MKHNYIIFNALIIFLLSGIILMMANCKKDYPKDIPNWLTEYIRECKRSDECCMYIDEWEKGDSILYLFSNMSSWYIYDYSGDCCIDICISCGNPPELSPRFKGFTRKRKIWDSYNTSCPH